MPKNQREDEELVIGADARAILRKPEAFHLREKRIKDFYDGVRNYFQTTCKYLLEKLPLNDPVLAKAVIVNPTEKLTAKLADVEFFVERYPILIPAGVTEDSIREQFTQYQITDASSCAQDRMDLTRNETGKQHSSLKGLSHVMMGTVTVPHSSAACERVFSTVGKNSTDQRASMLQDTVEALLVVKAKPGHCLDASRQHSESTLDRLKSAYSISLKKWHLAAHSSMLCTRLLCHSFI